MIILGLSSCFIRITFFFINFNVFVWRNWDTIRINLCQNFAEIRYNMKNSPELTLCMGLVCDNFGVVKLLYWNYKQSMTGNNESPPRVKIVFDNLFLTNCYDSLNLETLHVASYTVGEFYISPD